MHATAIYLINQLLHDVHIYGQYMYMNEEQTWHHRSMNSKCGEFSRICAIFSNSFIKCKAGTREETNDKSAGGTDSMHSLIYLDSFSRNARTSALACSSFFKAVWIAWRAKK